MLKLLTPALVCAALAAGLLAPLQRAIAQPPSIDKRLIAKQEPLTDDEKVQIDAFIASHKEALEGADPIKLAKARSALIQPLREEKVTTSFRIAFSPKALDIANRMFKAGDELHAANALRIAGELATPSAVSLLKDGLGSDKPGVRYAATFGYARMFESVERTTRAGGTPAPDAIKLKGCVDDLVGLLGKELGKSRSTETDVNVIDGAILALSHACKVPDKNANPVPGQPQPSPANSLRGYAVQQLAKASTALIAALDSVPTMTGGMLPRFLRSATAQRDALVKSDESTNDLKTTHPQAIASVCEFSSAMTALAARLEKNPPDVALAAELVGKIKSAAEQLRGLAECR